MKKIINLCLVFIFGCCVNLSAANLPSDQEINAALKKHLVIGKTSLRECENLFGKPVSVVKNAHATVYAFQLSAVAKGLKLNSVSIESQSSSTASKSSANQNSSSSIKASMASSTRQSSSLKEEKKAGNKFSKSDKESVDKIINFVFQENKLLSYKISSSH